MICRKARRQDFVFNNQLIFLMPCNRLFGLPPSTPITMTSIGHHPRTNGQNTYGLTFRYIEYMFLLHLIKSLFNFAQVYFENCFRGCFSDFMRKIAGYLTNKIGKILCSGFLVRMFFSKCPHFSQKPAPTLVIGGYYTICLIWTDNSFSLFNISETKVQEH